MGKNFPALCDQGLISACNFTAMLLAGRGLSQQAFGEFALAFSAVLLVNTIQSALITQPHGVLGSARWGGETYRPFTGSLAVLQIALAALAALIAVGSSGVVKVIHPNAATLARLLLWLAPFAAAWQIQEFARRVLYTEHRFIAAFFNDAIAYGGTVVALLSLRWRGGMTPISVTVAFTAANALAAVVGLVQISSSIRWELERDHVRECWHFGKWLVAAEVLNWFSAFTMFQYATGILLGAAASAQLKAAQVIFGPTRIIAQFLSNILPLRFSRTIAASGTDAMDSQLYRVLKIVIPASAAYSAAIAIFAVPVLRLFYGANKYESDWQVLALFGGTALLANVLTVLMSALTARKLTRELFIAFALAAVFAVPAAVIAIKLAGVAGAVCAMIATDIVLVILIWRLYRSGRIFSGS